MQLTVKLFAGLVELMGSREVTVELTGPLDVSTLKSTLMSDFPQAASQIANALVAVNQKYASNQDVVNTQDEIALIPPVGGGSDDEVSDLYSRISETALDVNLAFRTLEDVYCGGTVLFVGTVREWTRGKQTLSLDYEAYTEMALRQMERIHAEVRLQFPDTATLMWHRVGHLVPTDVAVVCAAASPHRDTAFTVTRILIERLKKEVPIWKREAYADGDCVWQPNEI